MAKKKKENAVRGRGRPFVGKKGYTIKLMPDVVERVDKYLAAQESAGKATDRSSLFGEAITALLNRRSA